MCRRPPVRSIITHMMGRGSIRCRLETRCRWHLINDGLLESLTLFPRRCWIVAHVGHVYVLYTSSSTFFLYVTGALNKLVQTLNAAGNISFFLHRHLKYWMCIFFPLRHSFHKFIFPSVYCKMTVKGCLHKRNPLVCGVWITYICVYCR